VDKRHRDKRIAVGIGEPSQGQSHFGVPIPEHPAMPALRILT
jgi:hypothetical protein